MHVLSLHVGLIQLSLSLSLYIYIYTAIGSCYKILIAISHKLKDIILHFRNMHMHITNQGHTRAVHNWHFLVRFPLLHRLIPEHLLAEALAYCWL